MRSALVKSVCTGMIRAAPISAAFSTMKSVRAFLIGANSSQRSVVAFAAGAFLMRGAGCTWNDVTDRHFDGAGRAHPLPPHPLGRRHRQAGFRLRRAQALLAFFILLTFNDFAIMLGIVAPDPGHDLSLRQALHLVAAGVPGPRLQLGRADGLGLPYRRAGAGAVSCSISAASPGRCITTRSTRIRTRRTTR
jgi:hypothetical protein